MASKLIINYDPNLEYGCVPDGKIEASVLSILKEANEFSGVFTFTVSQELAITMLRVAIARGVVDYSIVEFHYNGNVMFPDKHGYLDWWCKGFCDYTDNLTSELLGVWD